MKQYLLSTVAMAVVLALAGPARAATENVIAQAVGDQQPGVVAFYDSADGKTSGIDNQMSQSVASALAGAHFLLTDAGHLVVLSANATSSSAQPVLPEANAVDASGNQGIYYLVHMRSGSNFLDGAVSRDAQDASANYAILDLVLFDQQGDSEAIHIEQNLTWATNAGTGTSPGSGLNPGSGNSTGSPNPLGGSNSTNGTEPSGNGSNPLGGSSPLGGGSEPTGTSGPLGGSQPTGTGGPSIF